MSGLLLLHNTSWGGPVFVGWAGWGEGARGDGSGRSGTKARAPCSSTTLHPPCSVFPLPFCKLINNNALAFLARSWCHGLVGMHNVLLLRLSWIDRYIVILNQSYG